jgi:hypothetical protein
MRQGFIRKFVFLILCGGFAGCLFGQDKPPDKLPAISDIFSQFIKKGEADSFYTGENFSHEEQETTEDIKDGIVKGKDNKQYLVMRQNNVLQRKLISKDGELVNDSKFEPKKELISLNTKFFQRYIFYVDREEFLEGIMCWVLSFKPRANFPEEKREDRVINNLGGEVWLEKDTLTFKQLKANLTKEVKYALPGIAGGKVKKVNCVISGMTIDGHFAVRYVWVEYEYSASMLFWPISGHSIKKINYQKYERRTK